MNKFAWVAAATVILTSASSSFVTGQAQNPAEPPPPARGGQPGVGPAGAPPVGRGGRGGGPRETKLVSQFDKDGDGRLNAEERKPAREAARQGGGGRRGGGRGRGGENAAPPTPGPKVSPAAVRSYPNAAFYDSSLLRTLFLTFEATDWEQEMADFNNTDVDIPFVLMVDGKAYPNVGVHFRGASSFFTVAEGGKRSLALALDYADSKQRLYGYRTLNFLNSHTDPTFLHTVLYYHVAQQYLPCPKANHIKLVINGESWGLYVNAQQVNKEFLQEWFPETKGTRWKTPGSPQGSAGLLYFGENVDEYRRRYEIKTEDKPQAWASLIRLCRILTQTPIEQLEETLAPVLNIDRALWFLALENVLISGDGYWTRASDYNMFEDGRGRFHLIPHDANETFRPAGGRGGGGGSAAGGVALDPFAGQSDTGKPLLNRLVAVPSLRARYLHHVRTVAEEWLDWNRLGPVVEKYAALIDPEVKNDTRKLQSYEQFKTGVSTEPAAGSSPGASLKRFAEQRREFILNHPEIKKPTPEIKSVRHRVPNSAAAAAPRAQEAVQVSAEVTEPAGMVFLYYATAKEAPFKRVEMKKSEAGSHTATIPPAAAGAEVHYYVEARNTEANTASFAPAKAEFGALKYKVQK